MSTAAIRTMANNEIIYLYANLRRIKLTVTPYYDQRDFLKRSQTPFKRENNNLPLRNMSPWTSERTNNQYFDLDIIYKDILRL